MGVLEICLTVGGIIATMIWEYYREKQAAKGQAEVEVELNTPLGDIVTINDVLKVTLEKGSINDKTINVEKGKLNVPGREEIELKDATINLKKMKIKSPHLEKPINLKKLEKQVHDEDDSFEQDSSIDLEDVTESLIDVAEDAIETAAQPNAENIASTSFSVLKLLGHVGLWLIGKSKAHQEGESVTEHSPLMVVNGKSEAEIDEDTNKIDMEAWIDEVHASLRKNSAVSEVTEENTDILAGITTNPVTKPTDAIISNVDSTTDLIGADGGMTISDVAAAA